MVSKSVKGMKSRLMPTFQRVKLTIHEVPWVPELDDNRLDLRYFDKPITRVEGGHISSALNMPTLSSPPVSQTQDSFSESLIKSELQAVKSFSMLTRPVPRIPRPISVRTTFRGNKKHTACLDVVVEVQDEDGPYEPRTAMDLSNGVDFEGRLEEQLREQVANNRASFWDTLSNDVSDDSGNFLDFKDALHMPERRPQKLRKRKPSTLAVGRVASVMPRSTAKRAEQFKNKLWKKVRILGSLSPMAPQDSYSLNFPTGIVQTGHGIEYTCNLDTPTASTTSACAKNPPACNRWLPNRFLSRSQKAQQHLGQEFERPTTLDTEEDREIVAIMKEIYGNSWSPEMSTVDLSLPLASAVDPPHIFSSSLVALAESIEVMSGDLNTTLRLVTPPTLPLCD